jgi:Domain of unknown function (DUF6896)
VDTTEAELADRTVVGFLRALAIGRRELLADFPQASSIRDIIYLAQRREIPRTGSLGSGGEYSVHGVGCLITTSAGLEVDVDILDDGTEVFDPWRMLMFARSAGVDELTEDRISDACLRLAERNHLDQPKPGWFTAL